MDTTKCIITPATRSIKIGVVLHRALSESQWTVLLGYLVISKMLAVDDNFVFQQVRALVHSACNIIQLLQCTTLNFRFLDLLGTAEQEQEAQQMLRVKHAPKCQTPHFYTLIPRSQDTTIHVSLACR